MFIGNWRMFGRMFADWYGTCHKFGRMWIC